MDKICKTVAKASRRLIPDGKPVTGPAAFMHESGIHCQALLNNRLTYEPFTAAEIGRKIPEFVLGKHSGTASIKYILSKQGCIINEQEARALLARLRDLSTRKKAACSIDELMIIYNKITGLTNTPL